jgi:hypothetical protein
MPRNSQTPISQNKISTTSGRSDSGWLKRVCRYCHTLQTVHCCTDADCWWPDLCCQPCVARLFHAHTIVNEAHA